MKIQLYQSYLFWNNLGIVLNKIGFQDNQK